MTTSSRLAGPAQLRDAYRRVMDRVASAATRSGRRPGDVVVVAVTKTASVDMIRALVEMGHIDFGESRVQQLCQRAAQIEEFISRKRTLGGDDERGLRVRWHMIGHLQRNKVKQVVPIVKLIHSVDSLRLAEELHGFGSRNDPEAQRPIEVLLQVNSTGEEQKFGLAAPAVPHLAEQIDTMVHLKLRGIMTMAGFGENAENARGPFSRTADLFHEMRKAGIGGDDFNILSMGMSDDFEIGIEEGANVVRVGRALFGEQEVE